MVKLYFPPHITNTQTADKSLVWETENVKTVPDPGGGSFSVAASSMSQSQCELPGVIPTPARDLNYIVANTQDSLERMNKEQGKAIKELKQCITESHFLQQPL